jgi:hypothetical protein
MSSRPDLGSPDLRIHYLRVTNNGDADFHDMYDGIPITIDRHSSQNLQLDMAAHLFGYGYGVSEDAMFSYTCKRQGWNTKSHLEIQENGKSLAQNMFGQFELKPVIYKMVEEKPDLDAPIPADPIMPDAVQDIEVIPPLPPRRKAGAA